MPARKLWPGGGGGRRRAAVQCWGAKVEFSRVYPARRREAEEAGQGMTGQGRTGQGRAGQIRVEQALSGSSSRAARGGLAESRAPLPAPCNSIASPSLG